MQKIKTIIAIPFLLFLMSCSTAKQQTATNESNSGTSISQALGVDEALNQLSALIGGKTAYYASLSSLKEIKSVGGESFKVGDNITIIIPSDVIFDPATSDFVRHGDTVLNHLATYLSFYPHDNILITANTANIGTRQFEDTLSASQAEKIALFLEKQGINSVDGSREMRYSGLGSRSPIASLTSAKGLYQNRRIQITLYPQSNPPIV